MTECKGVLKVRWTATEVAMLTEEWSNVCACPNAKSLKGDDLNQTIFERYNARCARTKQLRRSPLAVATQRVRMVNFARFVVNFNHAALTQGRTTWFDLSNEEQLRVEIPNEWRRQMTTFTQEMFNTFKRFILPMENAHGAKRKQIKKLRTKHKKASSQSSNSQKQRAFRLERQPCWTTREKVLLAQRWGDFMKHEQLTLKEFEGMTFDKSCTYLASSTRSAFSAWRKSRTLLSSWRFISAFNMQHQPGWFKLKETERELLITWTELPDDFDDIDLEVTMGTIPT
ncbi:Hypothetical protein PHPALM_14970 [Phytophthora palmivora]|uniref:Uncharacterized protein n=1 Tax=Phytophthora palmivora TaxID=4796 RepID=A0A2P4XTA3_9STRA|nr:Hypothetical protein PHPALM_14970 [Phytophthora palmivora]